MTERERLIKLIEQCSCHYSPPCTGECGECHNVEMYDRNIEHIADHLLANGVIVVDTDHVDVVANRKPLRTAFNMPLDELAELIRAKQEGRLIVSPVMLGSRQRVYIPVCGTTVVYGTKVYGIGVDEDGDMVINPKEYPEDVISINGFNIGKTVFLTREEAEKALAERSKT